MFVYLSLFFFLFCLRSTLNERDNNLTALISLHLMIQRSFQGVSLQVSAYVPAKNIISKRHFALCLGFLPMAKVLKWLLKCHRLLHWKRHSWFSPEDPPHTSVSLPAFRDVAKFSDFHCSKMDTSVTHPIHEETFYPPKLILKFRLPYLPVTLTLVQRAPLHFFFSFFCSFKAQLR